MADADTRIETLEDEIKVLKGEVRRTLVDLRALLMREDSPLNEAAIARRVVLAKSQEGDSPPAPVNKDVPDVARRETSSQPLPPAPEATPPGPPPAAVPMPQPPPNYGMTGAGFPAPAPAMPPGPPPGPNPMWAAGAGHPPGPPPGPPSASPGLDSAAADRERAIADQQRRMDEQERRMAEQERRIADAARPRFERDRAAEREQPKPEPKKPADRLSKPEQVADEEVETGLSVEVLLAKPEQRQEEPDDEDQDYEDEEQYDEYGDEEADGTLEEELAPAASALPNAAGRGDEELKSHRPQEPRSGREKLRRHNVEDTVEEAASAPTGDGRSSRVYGEYIDLLAEIEECGVEEGVDASLPLDVNLVSSLTRWATVAKQRVGEQRLKEILDLYSQSGHLKPDLRQLIEQIFNLVGESGPEVGEDAQGCLDLIFHLHGILAGGLAIRQIPLAKISA